MESAPGGWGDHPGIRSGHSFLGEQSMKKYLVLAALLRCRAACWLRRRMHVRPRTTGQFAAPRRCRTRIMTPAAGGRRLSVRGAAARDCAHRRQCHHGAGRGARRDWSFLWGSRQRGLRRPAAGQQVSCAPRHSAAARQVLPSKNQAAGLPAIDLAVGLFSGIPLGLTNVGGIDLLVNAAYIPKIGSATSDIQIDPKSTSSSALARASGYFRNL